MAFNSETAKQAGEKSKRGESKHSKVIRDLITDEDAETALLRLKELALSGQNLKALELYLAYAFGKPKQQDEEPEDKTIVIRVIRDGDKDDDE